MKNKRIITGTCALITFIIIAYFVSTGEQLAFDTVIRESFYSIRSDFLNTIIIGITYIGNTETIIALCLILLLIPRTRKNYGLPVSLAAIASSLLNNIMKATFQRPRPDEALHLIEQGGWSFPSGHSITSLVVFGLLIWLIRRRTPNLDSKSSGTAAIENQRKRKITNVLTILLLIPCFGIGLSRIYVGVHYPTDVLGGWMLGTIILMIAMEVIEKNTKNHKK